MLGVMEGAPDANDPRTSECAAPPNHDYTPFLKADALEGVRIGIPRAGIYEARKFPGQARPFRRPEARRTGVDGGGHCRPRGGWRRGGRSRRPAEHDRDRAREEPHLAQHLRGPVHGQGGRRPVLDRAALRHEARLQPVAGDARRVGAGQDASRRCAQWNVAHKDQGAMRYGQGRLDYADSSRPREGPGPLRTQSPRGPAR